MIPDIALVVALAVPLAFACISVLVYMWWRKRDKRRSPLKGRLHHAAGEQLEARVQTHSDGMTEGWMFMFMSGPLCVLAWALQFVPWRQARFGMREGVFLLVFLVLFALGLRDFIRHAGRRRRAREGLAAERMSAQELNRLMALGCQVFHDVPGEPFNIDHVVVSPRAVFVVETKSRKKPPKTDRDDHFVFGMTGSSFTFRIIQQRSLWSRPSAMQVGLPNT